MVFFRELVRSRRVAFVARSIYNEPYFRAHIGESIERADDALRVAYDFEIFGGRGRMSVQADPVSTTPDEDSPEHWFKKHQWGYGLTRRVQSLRYEVRHPVWACQRVRSATIEVDWARVYGPDRSVLAAAKPVSTLLAAGSPIEVRTAEPLDAA